MKLYIAEKSQIGKNIAKALGHAVRKDGYFQCGDDCVTSCVDIYEKLVEDAKARERSVEEHVRLVAQNPNVTNNQ